jgi:hypothetical protein
MRTVEFTDENEAFLDRLTAVGIGGTIDVPSLIPAFATEDTQVKLLMLAPHFWRFESIFFGIPVVEVEVTRKQDHFEVRIVPEV